VLDAGVLWQRRQALEPKWRDHELRYGRPTRQYLDNRQAFTFLSNASDDLHSCVQNILKMLDPGVQKRAFGPLGEPGDPALIEHIATRLVEVYEEMLDVAATLRGVGVSEEMAPLMEAAARLTDTPLRTIRDFIDQLVAEVDSLPERLALDKPITITLTLGLTIDEEAHKCFDQEMVRARQRLGI